jgi:hypothetical protein
MAIKATFRGPSLSSSSVNWPRPKSVHFMIYLPFGDQTGNLVGEMKSCFNVHYNVGCRWRGLSVRRSESALLSGKYLPVLIEKEAGWAAQPILELWASISISYGHFSFGHWLLHVAFAFLRMFLCLSKPHKYFILGSFYMCNRTW